MWNDHLIDIVEKNVTLIDIVERFRRCSHETNNHSRYNGKISSVVPMELEVDLFRFESYALIQSKI